MVSRIGELLAIGCYVEEVTELKTTGNWKNMQKKHNLCLSYH